MIAPYYIGSCSLFVTHTAALLGLGHVRVLLIQLWSTLSYPSPRSETAVHGNENGADALDISVFSSCCSSLGFFSPVLRPLPVSWSWQCCSLPTFIPRVQALQLPQVLSLACVGFSGNERTTVLDHPHQFFEQRASVERYYHC